MLIFTPQEIEAKLTPRRMESDGEAGTAAPQAGGASERRARGRPRKDGVVPATPTQRPAKTRGAGRLRATGDGDSNGRNGTGDAGDDMTTEEADVKEGSMAEGGEPSPPPCPSTGTEEPSPGQGPSPQAECSNDTLGHRCAFCHCGGESLLGQGDLTCCGPTPGFTPSYRRSSPRARRDEGSDTERPAARTRRSDSAGAGGLTEVTPPRCKRGSLDTAELAGGEKSPRQSGVARGNKREQCKSPQRTPPGPPQNELRGVGDLWDELSRVGLPDDVDTQILFNTTGHCWAHHCCAAWSEGVCMAEDEALLNVDKAVLVGLTQRCAYCRRLGATIKCWEEKCRQFYHYPCAAGAGTFQDIQSLTLLCPDHLEQAVELVGEEAECAICDSPGDVSDQLFCTSCGQHYHGACLEIVPTPSKRVGWQCPDCKICQTCKESGDDSKMLVCDTCDKGYHTFCLRPPMNIIPKNSWKCKNCRVCEDCGARSPGLSVRAQWYQNYSLCETCHRQRGHSQLCLLCGKTGQEDAVMLLCQLCQRWVHRGCDPTMAGADVAVDSQLEEEYACPGCLGPAREPHHPMDIQPPHNDSSKSENEPRAEHSAVNAECPAEVKTDEESLMEKAKDVLEVNIAEEPQQDDTTDQEVPAQSAEMPQPMEVDVAARDSQPIPTAEPDGHADPYCLKDGIKLEKDYCDQPAAESYTEMDKLLLSKTEAVQTAKLSVNAASPPNMVDVNMETEDPTAPDVGALKIDGEQRSASNVGTPPAHELKPKSEPENVQVDPDGFSDLVDGSRCTGLDSPMMADSSFATEGQDFPMLSDPSLTLEEDSLSPEFFLDSCSSDVPYYATALTPPTHGMGKPMMGKRRFSPGRPRVRQGRGGGFPGKRRPRGAGSSGRGGRGRSRIKTSCSPIIVPGLPVAEESPTKEDEEENTMHNTLVLFSKEDKYTLLQDMCVVCGSFGLGAEGRLLACSQCGQCYHPYCVSVKITKVVLSKGWRCLECTVCELCGKASDPGRLLLCDDCDISYHTYCLEPPLHTVPKGGWKCKWCVNCVNCGATSPGFKCDWQSNYTQCGPCASLLTCPICSEAYQDNELVIQCRQCERWVHASCENLLLEDAVEEAADQGFDCSTCRPFVTVPQGGHLSCVCSHSILLLLSVVVLDNPPKVYSRDGVYLTETGLTQLQSLLVPPVPRKQRRPKLRLKLPGQPDLVTELQSPIELHPQSNPLEQEPLPDDIKEAETMECDNKSETFTSPERETQEDSAVPCSKEVDSIKKRKRNPYRPGIGGFMVRHRGRGGAMRGRGVSRRGTGGARSDSLTSPIASDIGRSDDVTSEHLPETPMDEITATPEPIEKQKQRRWRKKKSALEDAFPTYLQEAFFGKGLLDTSKEKRSSLDLFSDEESAQPSEGAQQKPTPPAQSETPEVVARDEAGPTDDGTPVQAERLREPCPTSAPISAGTATDQGKAQAGLDLGSIPDEQSSSAQGPAAAAAATQRGQQLRPEPLDSLLGTSDLDRIVTDELAKIEAKDVADLFSAISPAGGSQPQPPVQNTHGILGAARNLTALSQFPAPGRSEPSPMMPQASFPEFSGCREKVSSFSPSSNPASPWSAAGAPPAVAGEGEGDGLSYNQRNILKWEKDELLGEMATTSPVLYANINFPNLKTEYPDWPTRAKQIAKLWRKASASEKAPFLQKARDNRAAVRISKAQRAGETLLRKPLELAEPVGGAQSEQHAKEQQRLREQLRLQSKQQAKLEATQRLEMAKQEQLLQQQRHPQGGQTDSQETSPARGGKLEINMSSPPHGGQEGSQQQSIGSQMRGDEQSSAGGKVEPQPKESPGGAASTEQQSMAAAPHDAELEKQKQRQKLRELLIRQQQQRKALHQEKALQEQMVVEGGSIPLRHWPQDDGAHQHEPPHNKPPPPYPSQTPFGGQRNFSELAVGRFQSPGLSGTPPSSLSEVHFRPQVPGEFQGLEFRNAGPRFQLHQRMHVPENYPGSVVEQHTSDVKPGDLGDKELDDLAAVKALGDEDDDLENLTLDPIDGKGGHQGPFTPSHSLPPPSQMSLQKEKSLLLDEQPLLLQDLVEQEKKEQQRQQMQAMLQQQQQRQQSITGSMFPNIDLDKFTPDDITDPIAKAKMVALKGINKVMTQGAMVVPSIARPRIPVMTQQIMGSSDPPPSSGQQIEVGGSNMMQMARPNPPTFGAVMTDADVGQYREWLLHTQALLQMQQKFLEDQIGAHRKSKKALSAKQRTAKKAGRELAEKDAEQLKNVTEQQSMVQKQLEQLRKQQKEHAELIEEFRTKHQQAHASGASSAGMSGALQGPPNMMPMGPGQQAGMGPLGPGQQPGMRPMMPGQQANMRPMGSIHQQGMSPMGPGSQQGMAGMAAGLQQGMGPMGLGYQQGMRHMPPGLQQSLRHMGPGHQQGMRQMMPGQQQAMIEESRSASGTNFDNNPFSDTFQDRERRERLRLQQEQQRIQLMQEVERHRAMQNYEVEFQKQPNIVSNAQSEVADGPLRHQAMLSAIQVQSNQPTIHLERAQQQQHQQRFMGPGHLAHGQMSRQQQHLMMGVRPVHGNTSVDGNQSQMAKCFGPETLDQESRLQQPPVPQSPVLAQPPGFVSPTHSGSVNFPQGPEIVHPGQGGIYPYRPGFPGNGAMFQQHVGPSGPRGPHQRLPFNPGMAFPGQPPRQPGLNQPQLGQEVGTMPLPPNYPGASTSLIQLYSNIIPEEKGKKKRMRKKKKEDEASCTPMSPGTPGSNPSIPSTPTTPSTPFANELGHGPHPGTPMVLQSPGSSGIGPHQMVPHSPGSHYSHSLGRPMPAGITRMVHEPFSAQDGMHHLQLKPEQMELGSCGGAQRPMGMMTGAAGMSLTQFGAVRAHHLGGGPHHNLADSGHMVSGPLAPPHSPIRSMSTVDSSMAETKSESGNELLKKLLQARHVRLQNVHAQYQLPMAGEVPAASEGGGLLPQQLPPVGSANYPPQMGCAHEGMERKREGKGNAEWRRDGREDVDTEPDPSCPEQRMRKVPKGVGKGATRKKRKKEDEEKWKPYTSTDALMSQLKQQLALLPLIEPTIKVNLGLFPPHGSNRLNGDSQLKGSFGSAVLDGVPDYYTELIFKQTNLSNPPTPPASLPPTPPPPGMRQKLLNGFATAEELTGVYLCHGKDVSLRQRKCLEPRRPPQAFPFPYVDGFGQMTPQGPRAVDVPASLPTPPHNGQEDVSRPQEALGERESPDSIIFTSSPESVTGTEPPRFPVMDERPDTSASPVIPLLPSAGTALGRSVRGGTLTSAQPQPYNGNDHVSVTLTLSTNAADDINIVVSAVAHLLRVAVPNSYEYSDCPVQRLPTHPLLGTMHPGQHTEHAGMRRAAAATAAASTAHGRSCSLACMASVSDPHVQHQQAQQQQAQQAQHGQQQARRQWCRHCDVVVLGSGVRVRAADLPFSVKGSTSVFETSNQEIVFCSSNCYSQYAAALQASLSQAKQPVTQPGTAPASQQPPDGAQAPPGQPPQPYQRGEMCLDVRTLPKYPEPDRKPGLHVPVQVAAPDSQPPAPLDVHAADMPEEPRLACSPARPPMSSPPRAPPRPIVVQPPACKKWKGVRWKKWRLQVTVLSHSGVLRPPSEDEIEELMRKLGTSLRPEPAPPDMRSCSFCHLQGDGATDGPARLLNLDLDIWVHLNCALWSSEVYETQAGALINVEGARRRGLGTKCGACLRMGATTSCNRPRCPNVYHFACALRMRCMFFKDKTVLCPAHRPRSSTGQELGCFAVLRRVYVQRDEVRQLASLVRRGPMGGGTFRVGSLLFHALGQILPGQASSPYFHSRTALYPIGYQATRLYWSTRYTNKRCRYLCSVSEAEGRPRFTVRIVEQGHEDLVHAASTPQGVWDKILEPVVRLRKGAEMLRLFPDYLRGEEMFGLTVQAVLRITESLPGVECCQNYMFRYGRHPLMELPLAVNPSGCARTEPRLRSHFKRPHTLNSSSNSKSFQSTMSGELSAPYSKQFVYSKSSQYRRMKTEWKINVYLARSRIQGLGLYASRDIEKHTMVIEYIGEIIRNEVANRHEKLYESTNRGVYMFRLDSEHVIDATITGGPARYINHSCAPNCVAELVTFDRENKIIISSCRRIQKGEELTYDYLFDFEDDQNKIPCHCGAINCRKWMN
ncbi:unnamed protein product [Lampetra fluviatilis]